MNENNFKINIDINSLFPLLKHSENVFQEKTGWYRSFYNGFVDYKKENKGKPWLCYKVLDDMSVTTIVDFFEDTQDTSFILEKTIISAIIVENDKLKVVNTFNIKSNYFFVLKNSTGNYTIHCIISDINSTVEYKELLYSNGSFSYINTHKVALASYPYSKKFSNLKNLNLGINYFVDVNNPEFSQKFKTDIIVGSKYNNSIEFHQTISVKHSLYDDILKKIYVFYDCILEIDSFEYRHANDLKDYFDKDDSNNHYFSLSGPSSFYRVNNLIQTFDKIPTSLEFNETFKNAGLFSNPKDLQFKPIKQNTINTVSSEGYIFTIKDYNENNVVGAYQFYFRNNIYTVKNGDYLIVQENNKLYLLYFFDCFVDSSFDAYYNEATYEVNFKKLTPNSHLIENNSINSYPFNNYYASFIINNFRGYKELTILQDIKLLTVFPISTVIANTFDKNNSISGHQITLYFDEPLANEYIDTYFNKELDKDLYFLETELSFNEDMLKNTPQGATVNINGHNQDAVAYLKGVIADFKKRITELKNKIASEYNNAKSYFLQSLPMYFLFCLSVSFSYIQPQAEKIPREIAEGIELNNFQSKVFNVDKWGSLTEITGNTNIPYYSDYLYKTGLKISFEKLLKPNNIQYKNIAFDGGYRLLPLPTFLDNYSFDDRIYIISIDRIYIEDKKFKGFYDPTDFFQFPSEIISIFVNENHIIAYLKTGIYIADIVNKTIRQLQSGSFEAFCSAKKQVYYIDNNILYTIDENLITKELCLLYEKSYNGLTYILDMDVLLMLYPHGFDIYQVINKKYFECLYNPQSTFKLVGDKVVKDDLYIIEYSTDKGLSKFTLTFYPIVSDFFVLHHLERVILGHWDKAIPILEIHDIDKGTLKQFIYATDLIDGVYYTEFQTDIFIQNSTVIKIIHDKKIKDINYTISFSSGETVLKTV